MVDSISAVGGNRVSHGSQVLVLVTSRWHKPSGFGFVLVIFVGLLFKD